MRISDWSSDVCSSDLLSAYLNSDPGKRMLVRQIGKIETASGLSVQIGRIEGSIYSSMTIHNLVVRDPQGVFLASPKVRLDWRPFAYVRHPILINQLTRSEEHTSELKPLMRTSY